ncbi:MAG: extracellular solute-binding protein, partial [Anaerolineae bacterium]|nr:extracellular solute-binding protein [Anaerolineae bacterium]
MSRKFVSLLVVAVFLLAACGRAATPAPTAAPPAPTQAPAQPTAAPPTATPTPACTSPATLDLYMVGGGDVPVRPEVEAALNEYIRPLICANIRFNIVGWGDWAAKAITGLQAGEKIDIIFTADWWFFNELVAQNLLLPLNDDAGPHGNLLQKYGQGILATINPGFITGSQINGVNYAIPVNKELSVPDGFIYNLDVAEKIGFTKEEAAKIKSMRDFEPWLEKAKALRPEEYPYLVNFMPGFSPWLPSFAAGVPQNILTMNILNRDASGKFDETIYNVVESDWFRDYVTLIRQWRDKGWVHPEAALTGYEPDKLMNAGKFFVVAQPLKGNGIKAQEIVQSSGNPNLRVAELEWQPKIIATFNTGGSMMGIPALSEHPVEAMKFINLLHSDPKVVNTCLYGVEGKHWKLDPDGRVNLIDNSWYVAHPGPWVWGNTQ